MKSPKLAQKRKQSAKCQLRTPTNLYRSQVHRTNKVTMNSISRSLKRSVLRAGHRQVQLGRNASSLVVVEHDGSSISPGALAAVTAASKVGGNVDCLVMGSAIGDIAKKAGEIMGVSKVLSVDNSALTKSVAENSAKTLLEVLGANAYTHVFAPASNNGKNYLPRAAALMDASPLTDITGVISEDTFQRPMYAGNAIATVQMHDAVKFLLVRATAFEKAEETGGR
jgi:electron transfer flavoprotein alpha subunit